MFGIKTIEKHYLGGGGSQLPLIKSNNLFHLKSVFYLFYPKSHLLQHLYIYYFHTPNNNKHLQDLEIWTQPTQNNLYLQSYLNKTQSSIPS